MHFAHSDLEYTIPNSLTSERFISLDSADAVRAMNQIAKPIAQASFSLDQIENFGQFMPGGFFIYKAYGEEELIYANDIVLDIFGCETIDEFKELTGFTFPGMVYKDDLKCIETSIAHQVDENDRKLDYVEYRIRKKDGNIRWVDDYGRLVYDPKYGEVFYVLIRDITEQHNARITLTDTDHLTRVFNRRFFDRELMRDVSRVGHFGGFLSLIMLDIDKFKDFNDRYGHLAGDQCLAHVAEAMRKALRRKGDMLFRYGGEEFAVILPGTDYPGATAVAQNILNAVRDLRLVHASGPKGIVTVSAGIGKLEGSKIQNCTHPCADLIRKADEALYEAKKSGRDTIRCHPE